MHVSMNECLSVCMCVCLYRYFDEKVKAQLSTYAKWPIEETTIFNPYSGITSNDSESFNALLKRFQEWKEAPVDVIALALKMLQV